MKFTLFLCLAFSATTLGLPGARSNGGRWFEGDCGRSKYADAGTPFKNGRIVGGEPAREHEFPWAVSVNWFGGHSCGGSIINSQWILSAAHCLLTGPGTYSIVVGEHLLSSSSPSEQVYQVDSYIRHPAYRAPGAVHPFDFDIALIKVVGNIQFNENVQPLCAPPQFESLDEYLDDVSIAIGWGTTSSGGDISDVLLYASMPVPTNADCEASLRSFNYPNVPTTDNEICAGSFPNPRDACQGDSGGPLMVQGDDGRFISIGIVSHGYLCAAGAPGVYARTSRFVDWVQDIIDNN